MRPPFLLEYTTLGTTHCLINLDLGSAQIRLALGLFISSLRLKPILQKNLICQVIQRRAEHTH